MRYRKPTLLLLLPSIVLAAFLFYSEKSVTSQRREKVNTNGAPSQKQEAQKQNGPNQNSNNPSSTATPPPGPEVIKVDVDLVTTDALVLQKKTARIVGGLKKEDFVIFEDGAKQEITHFSQDSLPLSVLLAIDRGACLDPYGDEVHRAAREAIDRLKPVDEIAVMAYANTTVLVESFTRNRIMIENALNRIPPQAGNVDHCMNSLFADAADYMIKASNPAGRRVVIVITGLTRLFDCPDGPSGKSAAQAIYESGSVVCGIIPKVIHQSLHNGIMTMATRVSKLGGADYIDIQTLANETGGEALSDKPENLDTTFQTLIDHLRSRYTMAFVSTNKKRDGTRRQLKLAVAPPTHRSQGKLVVKTRRSYIAPRS
jgi:Ca-activated chloride channel homolog